MRNFLKTLAISLAILIGSALIGMLLMLAVYLLPTGVMCEHVSESVLMEVWEGDYYRWVPKDGTSISDGYTDALMINTAIHEVEGSAVYDSLMNPATWYEGLISGCESVQKYVAGDTEGSYNKNYARYWHGYLILLKPLLLIFNYYRIRWINTMAGCVMASAVLLLLYKKIGRAHV